ncbi:MAG: DUF6933 domain-containing protein [Pseudomonas sp.]
MKIAAIRASIAAINAAVEIRFPIIQVVAPLRNMPKAAMLIFNCTQDATDFFSRIQKGKKISPVQSPPSRDIADDALTLAAAGGNPAELSQWLVHVAQAKRKNVIVAIHLDTRYCMFFCNVKKGDTEGFVRDFKARWVTGTLDHAMKAGLLGWIDPVSM